VRFIQMWVLPDERAIDPGYDQLELDDADLRGRLVPVASGMAAHAGESAIRIRNRAAALHVARLDPGDRVAVPDAPFSHVFVATGMVDLEGAGTLHEGDAVRLAGVGGQALTALEPAEVLVWEMHAAA
jgi:hypothetical protein